MPLKVYLNIKLSKEIETRHLTPDGVHGLFFSLIGNPLALELHEGYKNLKPYSIFCKELFKNLKTDELHLEINLLEDELTPKLLSSLILKGRKAFFHIKGENLEVNSALNVPQKWLKSYEVIFEETKPLRRVEVLFLKPTTFRRNDVDLSFPLPELVFKGLIRRWLKFSKIKPEVDLRSFYDLVEVESFELKTRKVVFANGGKLTTFGGRVVYNLSKVENEEALRWFGALFKYSLWSGIGRKTTMGLGKVTVKNPCSSNSSPHP